jgi:hypothetical protein
MIRLDLNAACNMACAGLPEGWVLEIRLEKRASLLGLFPPNGARQDFEVTEATMAEQVLKAITVAKGFIYRFSGEQDHASQGGPSRSKGNS